VTTAEVNALGQQLVIADADGDAERLRASAYRLLSGLSEEHARADDLAARVHALTAREKKS
jgi:hypothetical protein